MDRRVPVALALVVALLLVANPLYLFVHAGQPAYDHSVLRIDSSDVPEDVTVREYGDLSPEARRALDAALASPDGYATVYGEANRPPEFVYTDAPEHGQGMYAIEKGGQYYRLTTYSGGGLLPVDLFAAVALALVGPAVGAAGVDGYRRGRSRLAAVAAGYGGVAVLAVAATAVGVDTFWALVPAVAALLVGYAGVGALVAEEVSVAVASVAVAGLLAFGVWYGVGVAVPFAVGLVGVVVPALVGWGGARATRYLRGDGTTAG